MAGSEASWIDDKEVASSPTGTCQEAQREPQWTDNVVPASHKSRALIVCFDGTGDKFDADVNTANLLSCSSQKLMTDPRIPTSSNSFRC